MRPRVNHLVHPNERTWSPHKVGFFDTEFPHALDSSTRLQPFLCAVGLCTWRHGHKPRKRDKAEIATFSASALADWVEGLTAQSEAFWLFAHNLGVDLQASGLLDKLLGRGWSLGRQGLGNGSPWAWLRQGRKTLRLCDLVSWLPTSEQVLGDLLSLPKLQMPERGAEPTDWLRYCQRDAEIGLRAVLELMDWWDAEDCGRWTDTGTGCGWNAMRHKLSGSRVWITQDPQAQAWERSGIYAGRREISQRGRLPEPEYVDLDLHQAHTSVARFHPLPWDRGTYFQSLPLDFRNLCGAVIGVMAECEVHCEIPRYPLRLRSGIAFPSGSFRTVLAGPELAEARRQGHLASVGPGWAYRLGRWAEPFAGWIAHVAEQREDGAPPTAQLAAKAWSKTVWGRWALRISGDAEESDGPHERLVIEHGRHMDTGARLSLLHWGYRTWRAVQDQEGDDSFPAVLAWIQSWVRVYIGRLIDVIGPEAIAQIATDGLLVAPWRLAELTTEAGEPIAPPGDLPQLAEAACRLLEGVSTPLRVRLKDVLHQVRIAGPDHLEAQEVRRLSGVPRSWEKVGDWVYQGDVWHSLAQMTTMEIPESVLVGTRQVDLSKVRPLRWVFEDGCCEPLRATLSPEGETVLLGYWGDGCSRHGAPLEPTQHPLVTRLLTEGPGRVDVELAAHRSVGVPGTSNGSHQVDRLRRRLRR